MVEAGCLARLIKLPEWLISLAPTSSPTSCVRLGAIAAILFLRYSAKLALYWEIEMTYPASVFR